MLFVARHMLQTHAHKIAEGSSSRQDICTKTSQVIEKLFLDPPAVLLAEQIDWVSIALENHVKVLDVEPAKLSQRCGRV